MWIALLLVAGLGSWIPARWSSADPASIALIRKTPVNCVLLEQRFWSAKFSAEASGAGIATLGVIHPGADPVPVIRQARGAGLAGLVAEGDFPGTRIQQLRRRCAGAGLKLIELPSRARLTLDSRSPVIGTCEGLWPGIHLTAGGAAKAAPSGAPWIDTNNGFLRFVRANTRATIWIAYHPPPDAVVPLTHYQAAIGDAAMAGARWIVTLDAEFNRRLLGRDKQALGAWEAIGQTLQFWEQHRAWTRLPACGALAVIQGSCDGALLSGGVLDMITAHHVPLRVLPPRTLSRGALAGVRFAVAVDPAALSQQERDVLKAFTRRGGTLLKGPPGWKFAPPSPGRIVATPDEVNQLSDIWRAVSSVIGRDNLGVRLFNVTSLRSALVAAPGGEPTVLMLVNYSDYPVYSITARPRFRYAEARLYRPGRPAKNLEIFDNGDIRIPKMGSCAILVLGGRSNRPKIPGRN